MPSRYAKFPPFGLSDLHKNLEHLLGIVAVWELDPAFAGDKILIGHNGLLSEPK